MTRKTGFALKGKSAVERSAFSMRSVLINGRIEQDVMNIFSLWAI